MGVFGKKTPNIFTIGAVMFTVIMLIAIFAPFFNIEFASLQQVLLVLLAVIVLFAIIFARQIASTDNQIGLGDVILIGSLIVGSIIIGKVALPGVQFFSILAGAVP